MATWNRREFLSGTAAALGVAPFVACSRARRAPNVVFILTADQRSDCLGVAGHPFLKTPNLDRLANEGVRFANAFATSSLCSPSRASFMSGRYAHGHGVFNNFTEYPDALPSYPKVLQKAGYQTAYIGKWHMGENNDEHRSGFTYWASHKGQGKYYDTEFNINGTRQLVKDYYTHAVTELAANWLKTVTPPFSLEIGHKAPHGLWIPEPKYAHVFDNVPVPPPSSALPPGTPDWVKQRIKTWHGIEGPLYGAKDYADFVRTYHATILSVDDSVGLLYDVLKAKGELDNTIILFAGDNGFLLGEHASIDKRTMWEESVRIPMLVRYPEVAKTPRVASEMVLNMDVAPSVLDLCGQPPFLPIDGMSVKPLLSGAPAPWRKSWMYEYNFETEFPYTPNVRGVRTDDWKYIHYPNGEGQPDTEKAELYDIKADPKEQHNLIDEPSAQGKLAELRTELDRIMQTTAGVPDKMPVNPKLSFEMPAAAIR